MNKTSIPWADLTWNPITGCTHGCDYCYARPMARRIYRMNGYDIPKEPVAAEKMAREMLEGSPARAGKGSSCAWAFYPTIYPCRLDEPLHVKKPSRIFLGSMGDLFDPAFPDDFRDRIFATVAATPQHTYLLLTKRPEEMRRYFSTRMDEYLDVRNTYGQRDTLDGPPWRWDGKSTYFGVKNPPANLWLGVTVTNQADADERIPLLLDTPAAHRFVSVEPMLGPVDFTFIKGPLAPLNALVGIRGLVKGETRTVPVPTLDWVVVGGKTPGKPLHESDIILEAARDVRRVGTVVIRDDIDLTADDPRAWLRSLCGQCISAGVPFFYKHGKDTPALDGVIHDAIPEEVAR